MNKCFVIHTVPNDHILCLQSVTQINKVYPDSQIIVICDGQPSFILKRRLPNNAYLHIGENSKAKLNTTYFIHRMFDLFLMLSDKKFFIKVDPDTYISKKSSWIEDVITLAYKQADKLSIMGGFYVIERETVKLLCKRIPNYSILDIPKYVKNGILLLNEDVVLHRMFYNLPNNLDIVNDCLRFNPNITHQELTDNKHEFYHPVKMEL